MIVWFEWNGLPKAGDVLEFKDGTTELVVRQWVGLDRRRQWSTSQEGRGWNSFPDVLEVARVWRAGVAVWEKEAVDGHVKVVNAVEKGETP
jgi:hypothetical protein